MKRFISFALVFLMFFSNAFSCGAAQPIEILPQYENAKNVNVCLTIDSSGAATVQVTLTGNSDLKKASVTTYLEKKVNGAWYRVDTTATNDQWVYTTTNKDFMQQYSANLKSKGEYRAVAVFTLTATTVEVITRTKTATY